MQDFSGFSIDLTAGSPVRSPRFEEYLANGLAVSFFTGTIPRTARAAFCFGEVKLEDGKSSMPLLHRRGNGASRFQAVPPLCTHRHRTTTLDLPLSAFRHLSTPPVISSRRYLNTFQHPDNARRVPFLTMATTTENGDGDRRGEVSLPLLSPLGFDMST